MKALEIILNSPFLDLFNYFNNKTFESSLKAND